MDLYSAMSWTQV